MQFARTLFTTLAFATAILSAVVAADEPRIKWVRRIDDAQRIAAAEDKDLFINFTGSEWCLNCIQLERAVLSRKEFAAAEKDFILVELDFPNNRDQLGELKSVYEKWAEEYLIQGYPTVVLADRAGRPYFYLVGYEEGMTTAAYLDQLRKAQQTRATRDRELAAAKETTGINRAQKLHAAIAGIAKGLGTIEDHDDDPVLALYGNEVAEICRLDAENGLGLRSIYDARFTARDAYRRRQAVYKELEKIGGPTDWAAKIAHIETRLPEIIDNDLRFELEWRRVRCLEASKQYAEALESVYRLVADPLCPVKQRRLLLFSEAMCLRRLGRIDEAVASFDRQIAEAADRPDAFRSLMNWRAQVLLGSERRADAVAAYRQLLDVTTPNSLAWTDAKCGVAMALARNDQHQESITLYQELIEHSRQSPHTDPVAYFYLAIAESQHAMGRDDEARSSLNDMERAIPTTATKPAEQNEIDRMRKTIVEMRKKIGQTK